MSLLISLLLIGIAFLNNYRNMARQASDEKAVTILNVGSLRNGLGLCTENNSVGHSGPR